MLGKWCHFVAKSETDPTLDFANPARWLHVFIKFTFIILTILYMLNLDSAKCLLYKPLYLQLLGWGDVGTVCAKA